MALMGDSIADYEYARARGGTCFATAELRLMFEVLNDAVLIYCGVRTSKGQYSSRRRMEGYRSSIAEAEEWIWDDSLALMGFRSVCQVMGIEPTSFRAGLKNWREMHEAGEVVGRLDRYHQVGKREPVIGNSYQRDRHARRLTIQRG